MAHEKILVIDDSQQIRDFLANQVLPRAGYRCVSAADGRAGLEMLGKEKPDLVLTDMQMPRMSGLEILQLLAQYKVDIPVVMMTAQGSETIAVEAFHLGVKDYIVKPFTIDDVLRVIEHALSETRLRREKEVLARNLAAANQELQRRVQEVTVLARVGQAVSALLDQTVLMQRIVEAAVFIANANRGALLLSDDDGSLHLSASTGFPTSLDHSLAPPRSLIASVMETQKPIRLALPELTSEPYGRAAPPPQAFMATPIVAQRKSIGALAVDRTQGNRPFNASDARLLAALADYAAISLQNARLFEDAKSAQNKLQTVINNTADGVIVLNARGEVLLANPAAHNVLGSDVQLKKPLFPSSANNTLIQLLTRATAQNKTVSQEIIGTHGKVLNVNISPAPELGFVAILHDITMLKELERIRREREQAENERLRATFERYVPPSVVDQLMRMGGDALAHPEQLEVIALFADLRGFDALFAQLPSDVLINDVLNRFLSTMSEIVLQHGGTIDKFMGDGVLAIFGWPLANADDRERAIVSAVEMQGALFHLRNEWQEHFGASIALGIGIGEGTVIAGSIGSEQRQDYTVIGEAVTRALELNQHAHAGEILMSHSIAAHLRGSLDGVTFDDFPPVRIKGSSDEHEIVLVRSQVALATPALLR